MRPLVFLCMILLLKTDKNSHPLVFYVKINKNSGSNYIDLRWASDFLCNHVQKITDKNSHPQVISAAEAKNLHRKSIAST